MINNNPTEKKTLNELLIQNPISLIGILFFVLFLTFLIASEGIGFTLVLIILPFILIFINRVFNNLELGLSFVFVMNFVLIGTFRYINIPFVGTIFDSLLIMIYIAFFFKYFYEKKDLKILNNDLIFLTLIWFAYIVMQILNPEASSIAAWFASMRGEALYMLLIIPLIFLIYNKPKNLDTFLIIWGVFSILGTIKGAQQLFFKPDMWEQRWLDEGAASTHVLFGRLRVFSFFTDAGVFGAFQGQSGVLGTILLLNTKSIKMKIFWVIVTLFAFYGMFISGTRGAMAVPLAGFFLYIILKKQIKVILVGIFILISIFIFFKFTKIGNDNYQINRMRTAFDTEDKSLNTRLNNQILFANYLSTRPFGVGIGHAGKKAQRYVPNSFLANIATDSWFVMIWAESGVVGLFLHMFILFYIVGKGAYIIMFQIKNKEMFGKLSALLAGLFGIIGASYGNAVLGQFPLHIICYSSMAFIFLGTKLDDDISKNILN